MSVGGEFWISDNPGHRVRGEFIAEAGERPEATLTANLVDDPRVAIHKNPAGKVTGFAVSGLPARSSLRLFRRRCTASSTRESQ